MNTSLLYQLLEGYQRELKFAGAVLIESNEYEEWVLDSRSLPAIGPLDLALVVVTKMLTMDFNDEGKTNRWLGFVQCLMLASGLRSVNEMREENRLIFN